MAFGIQPSGFIPKLQSDCLSDIVTAVRSNVDPNFDMSPDQPIGQMANIVASENAEFWELLRALYSGLNPNNAEGFILDGVAAYTGTERDPQTYSTVVCAMGLNGSSSIPAGSTANVLGQPSNTWQLVGPGDNATGLLISSGPVVSTTAGPYYGFFRSTSPGPVLANAGQLSVITTAVAGWNTVTNPAGCKLGTNTESDASLLAKRESELAASGSDTVDAIRAALLEIKTAGGANAVQQAFVYENTGDVVDGNGVPPHTIHVIIYDGPTPAATNQQIVDTIWKQKASGVGTYGATSATTVDTTGNFQTVKFDRATVTPVYLSLTTTRGSTFDAVNGPAAIKAALVAYWQKEFGLGVPMIARFIGGAANRDNIQGLVDVPTFFLGLTYNPVTSANLPSGQAQILTLNTGVDGSAQQYILVDGV